MNFSMMAAPYLVILLVIFILIGVLYFVYKINVRINERKKVESPPPLKPEKFQLKKKRSEPPLRDSKGRFLKRPF